MAVARIRGQGVACEHADGDSNGESKDKFVLVKESDFSTEEVCNGEARKKWTAGQASAVM